jgi:hypothetical protein
MFTTLIGGLCAFVLETSNDAREVRGPDVDYPAVAIGIVVRDQCRISLVVGDGKSTPFLLIKGQRHAFKVAKIDQTSAILWIDENQSFAVPRANVF